MTAIAERVVARYLRATDLAGSFLPDGLRTTHMTNAALSGKLQKLFEPLLKRQDEALEKQITKDVKALRSRVRKKFKKVEDVDEHHELASESSGPSLDPDVWSWINLFGRWASWDSLYKAPALKRALNELIKVNLTWNRLKLEAAVDTKLGKLPVVKVEEVSVKRRRQGLEGSYRITLEDGTVGMLHTTSIAAGGHNIQRYHYRYLMKLDQALGDRQEKAPDPVDPKVAEVMAILAKHIKSYEPGKSGDNRWMSIPNEAKWEVEKLKGASRNWGPVKKAGYVGRFEEGRWAIKRYNYVLFRKGFEALKGFQ